MNRLTLSVLAVFAVGAAVIAATAVVTYPKKSATTRDQSKYRYMHCPECKRETTYRPGAYEQPCPYCDKHMVGTEESVKLARNPYSRMLALVLVEANLILGALVYLLYNPPKPRELEQYYTSCPNQKCKRRMRYPANRAGLEAQCPLCKTTFVNPTLEEQWAISQDKRASHRYPA